MHWWDSKSSVSNAVHGSAIRYVWLKSSLYMPACVETVFSRLLIAARMCMA